jgi:hypothetical protein
MTRTPYEMGYDRMLDLQRDLRDRRATWSDETDAGRDSREIVARHFAKCLSETAAATARTLFDLDHELHVALRDKVLEEAAASLDNYSSPTDVGEEMAHMFARRIRALKSESST